MNKIPKWLAPAYEKEIRRKTTRQSNDFSKINESFKVDKTDLSVESLRNLKMLVLNVEFLDSKIDSNKIEQADLNMERFFDKIDLDSPINCEAVNEQVKVLASTCFYSSKASIF